MPTKKKSSSSARKPARRSPKPSSSSSVSAMASAQLKQLRKTVEQLKGRRERGDHPIHLLVEASHRLFQLFDMIDDPDELDDLAERGAHAATLARCEQELRAIIDPDELDARAREDQQARIERLGGADAVVAMGQFGYTKAPGEFQ